MRILFWKQRRFGSDGGDLVGLDATRAALRALAVESEVSDDPNVDLTPYDLVHLYNLADVYVALEYVIRARRARQRIVITPIYWRHRQWLAARAAAAPETHPEFFLGADAPDERARTQRVLALEEMLYVALHEFALAQADLIFPLSEREADIYQSDFNVPVTKLRVTPNGIAPLFGAGAAARFIAQYGVRDFVLSVARIEERKNTIGLIRAWRAETTPLVLIGAAPDARYLELCRAQAGPQVLFLGRLAPNEVADAYAAAKVHVLASWWEEAALAALEAARGGCNLVMTQYSSARDYFGDAVWLCDPADEASICRAVRAARQAPRQPALAAQVRDRFTWEHTAQILCEAYQEVRASARRPADADTQLMNLADLLAALWELKEEHYHLLAERARAQTDWLRALEKGAQQHARAPFAPLQWARRLVERVR